MNTKEIETNLNEIEMDLKAINYTLDKKLHTSKMSWVYVCIKNNEKYVIKIISNTPKNKSAYLEEIKNQNKCDKHPNIAKIYETFRSANYLYITLGYCPKNSLKNIGKKLDWDLIKFYYSQVVKGLIYIHEQHIIHRDIKVNNIIICGTEDEEIIKIIDFGLSCEDDDKSELNQFSGTLPYISPEMLRVQTDKNFYYDNRVDIWALGVSIYYSYTLRFPFRGQINMGVFKLFYYKDYMNYIQNNNIKVLLSKIFINREKRISLEDISIFFDEN